MTLSVEVVAIGDEVLAGHTVNGNAAQISRALQSAGFEVFRHTVLSDAPSSLLEGLKEAMTRSSLVITTGGLGPTLDDHTRSVLAALFEVPLCYSKEIARKLKEKFAGISVSIENQAMLPEGAHLFPNPIGTAQGFLLEREGRGMIALPGVPREVTALMEEQVVPYLQRRYQTQTHWQQRQIHLCKMAESTVDPLLRELKRAFEPLQVGIYPNHGIVTVRLRVDARESQGKEILDTAQKHIEDAFPGHCFAEGSIEEAVHATFIQRGLTLGLAESCTGGRVASRLTRLPGASRYFRGSVVAYDNSVKRKILGVDAALLEQEGAVSEAVVRQMAEGALRVLETDYALAVSGVAGPGGGTPEKPVGTVWAALSCREGGTQAWTFRRQANRETVIHVSVHQLLSTLWMTVHS